MTDSLIILLVDIFNKLTEQGKDGFLIIGLSVPCKVLYELYERLSKVDVPPIESLPEDEKTLYWEQAKTFYTDQEQAIKASKSIYILKIITNS